MIDALPGAPVLWSVPLLAPAACAELRARLASEPWSAAPEPILDAPPPEAGHGHRLHVELEDAALAAALYALLEPHLPAAMNDWQRVGLCAQLTAYRYPPGTAIPRHRDTPKTRHDFERGLFVALLYLNDGFEGGATQFFDPPATVRPRTGHALCFWHALEHASAPVSIGEKHVLRVDVLYRREGGISRRDPRSR